MPGPQHGFSEDLADDPGSLVASPKTTARSLPRNNLPLELSSFVGRGREINEIEGLLADHRLLTLAGPGGSGKTRLALRVAAEVAEGFEDGVWLVELAPLSDPDLVSRAVASVLGVRETPGTDLVDSLCVYLASRGTTLMILDNCEHIVDACASLSEALLHRCPKLRILATSRETLRVPGETLFAVPPLSLPDPRHSPTVASLPAYEATGLFVERTRAVKPDFSLTEGNAMAVAQVCYRLDGIPLALELAAARARVLSVEQISSRLDESFRLLTASGRRDIPHHRTLRATMDWSYELLSAEEQTLFRRLSVFAGGWTLEAAEEVCAGEGLERDEVLDLLTSLVDKSLVLVSEQDGEARYRLLETVRQYGREKLEESGEAGEMRGRHAEHYYTLALEAGPLMMGRDQVGWLDRTWREQHNFRAAMRFFLDRKDAARAISLTWAFWRYWWVTGLQGEARRWMEEALQSGDLPGDDVYPALKAQANLIIGTYAWSEGDLTSALPALEEGLRLSRKTGDARGQAIGLMLLGRAQRRALAGALRGKPAPLPHLGRERKVGGSPHPRLPRPGPLAERRARAGEAVLRGGPGGGPRSRGPHCGAPGTVQTGAPRPGRKGPRSGRRIPPGRPLPRRRSQGHNKCPLLRQGAGPGGRPPRPGGVRGPAPGRGRDGAPGDGIRAVPVHPGRGAAGEHLLRGTGHLGRGGFRRGMEAGAGDDAARSRRVRAATAGARGTRVPPDYGLPRRPERPRGRGASSRRQRAH
jgi:predicted ATPase